MTDTVIVSLPRFSPGSARRLGAAGRSPGIAIAVLVHLVALYFVATARIQHQAAPPAPLQVTLVEQQSRRRRMCGRRFCGWWTARMC